MNSKEWKRIQKLDEVIRNLKIRELKKNQKLDELKRKL